MCDLYNFATQHKENFPELLATINSALFIKNNNGTTPMDFIIPPPEKPKILPKIASDSKKRILEDASEKDNILTAQQNHGFFKPNETQAETDFQHKKKRKNDEKESILIHTKETHITSKNY